MRMHGATRIPKKGVKCNTSAKARGYFFSRVVTEDTEKQRRSEGGTETRWRVRDREAERQRARDRNRNKDRERDRETAWQREKEKETERQRRNQWQSY